MWLLFLAGASLLAFVSIVLLLWLADARETRNHHPIRKAHVEPPFPVLSIAQAFEPVFAALWEAPIHALQLVQSGGTSGIPISQLRPSFNEAAIRFPEIYDGHTFEECSGFSKRSSSLPGPAKWSHSLRRVVSSLTTDSRPKLWRKHEP